MILDLITKALSMASSLTGTNFLVEQLKREMDAEMEAVLKDPESTKRYLDSKLLGAMKYGAGSFGDYDMRGVGRDTYMGMRVEVSANLPKGTAMFDNARDAYIVSPDMMQQLQRAPLFPAAPEPALTAEKLMTSIRAAGEQSFYDNLPADAPLGQLYADADGGLHMKVGPGRGDWKQFGNDPSIPPGPITLTVDGYPVDTGPALEPTDPNFNRRLDLE